uniref:RING-type E3 ubiquitin transferase n=1 Tax=Pinguiococcus pyrenoidosus TaxID=172671 RepID=A0A7R9YCF3_9STRA
MGRNQHSKDRLFLTTTEWRRDHGGRAVERSRGPKYEALPFDCCALTLTPYEDPVCTPDGVLFDLLAIVPYLKKHKKSPITGEAMKPKQLLRLNMQKNAEGKWHCPVTYKPFGPHSRVVAIRTSGNVFSYDAVEELNLKPKNFVDLVTGQAFLRSDIIWLQDPSNPELMRRRDISSFKHLEELRQEEAAKRKADVNRNVSKAVKASRAVAQQARSTVKQKQEEERKRAEEAKRDAEEGADVTQGGPALADLKGELQERQVTLTTSDVTPGSRKTSGAAGRALTSSAVSVSTAGAEREASDDEIVTAIHAEMRRLGKKGLVQLQTTLGNLNLEIHADMVPATSHNFLGLCKKGYYNGTIFHRVIPGFMAQGGDPKGTGTGGKSVWGGHFRDEFDLRLRHNCAGVLSMANSGPHSNGSQFFITFKETPHLDNKHSVFGRVVGGMDVLHRLGAVETGDRDKPRNDVTIERAVVFVDPVVEAEALLAEKVRTRVEARLAENRDRSRGAHIASGVARPGASDEGEEGATGASGERVGHLLDLPAIPTATGVKRARDTTDDGERSSVLAMAGPIETKKAPKMTKFSNFDAW